MPPTIDNEARQQRRSPFDISKMSDRFKTSNGLFSFDSPSLDTIEKNLYFLLRQSTVKNFERKYRFRPDYLSFDEYGTPILDKLLMYVNNVQTVEDFKDLKEVIIPTKSSIVEILKDNFPDKDPADLDEVDW
jgi:alpha-L-fucosidase